MKKSDYQDQLNKYTRMKENMEKGIEADGRVNQETVKLIKIWKEYCTLTQSQKDMLLDDWNGYFKQIPTTKAYKRFMAQGRAWKAGKMDLVKEYAEKAREQRKSQEWELPRPALEDPLFLENSQTLIRYRWIISKINDLEKNKEDYAVFSF